MRVKKAKIDSLNLRGEHIESVLIHSEDYIMEIVKSKGRFEPKAWSMAFGRALKRNVIEAKIVHSHLGITLPLKTYAATPKAQTLEFAGLHGYNERSKHLCAALQGLKSQLSHARVTRIDIAIDYEGSIPQSILKALSKHREPFRYGNTTYYKTAKEKKLNRWMDIKIYDKAHQAGLEKPMMRLEFCFKSEYLGKLILKDLSSAKKKMEKSIKKATGLSVKIEPILAL